MVVGRRNRHRHAKPGWIADNAKGSGGIRRFDVKRFAEVLVPWDADDRPSLFCKQTQFTFLNEEEVAPGFMEDKVLSRCRQLPLSVAVFDRVARQLQLSLQRVL